MNNTLGNFTDVLADEICDSQPMSLSPPTGSRTTELHVNNCDTADFRTLDRPPKGTGQRGQFRSTEEIDPKYRDVFSYPYFNLVQSNVIEEALYSDKSIVVCAPTGSGKTVVFEMAIVQLLMELEEKNCTEDFKIIYMAPVKALCTERLTEWYPKFTRLGLLCIEVTGDTDVDFTQLKPYKIIITTPEKWDMLTRRWRDHRGLVEVIKLFLIDEVHILNDELRGPVLEAVVSRMKTIENSAQSAYRIEKLQKEMKGETISNKSSPRIRFVAVSATVSNPEDVADWLGTGDKPAVFFKFGDECRPVKIKRIVEGYPCAEGTSIFKFDIILNYKLWPIIQKYHSGKPTLIFCNTRKSVILTAETLSRELTISFNLEQKAKLTALASSIKNKKLQALVMSGVGCHHAGLLYEERQNIELAFRNRDLPILITTTTLAMGVNLPAHLVIVKNTQQYVNGAYQEYSISTVLQMVGRAGRPQFDTEATAVIMTRLVDKPRYQALVGGCEPLQSYLHKRLAENLNSEAALGTVGDVAQCVQWLRSTFLYVRAARDPKKYLGLPQNSPQHLISKKVEELCVKAMNGLATSGLITMDEASCIESTEAGRLMSIFYLDLETMKNIMKIEGTESLERLLALICESHELADMHLRVDERRCLNTLNRNNAAATIRFPMKGKISTRQMKLNCIIQAVLGCLTIPDPSLNQEAMKIMRIADRICKCLVTYVTRPELISQQPQFYSAVLNTIILAKCINAHLWENSTFVSKQLKGIGPTFSALLASAGKVNFMLLEESHPRDLERIMNKGAPAGNILRKQVSLLPKYQLTMIPVDERTVTVQLLLSNQCHLSENMENLTAGDSHKSYIIVGDSNNHLLLLAAFKDKDLISVFDGTISHQVRRKHNFEHKIFAHCISSSFVGIDVQSEYLFNGLDQFFGDQIPVKKTTERQTSITETFKERKRKNTDVIDKTQSKEKKKRDIAIIEQFKLLKDSFKAASKNLKQNGQQQSNKNDEIETNHECTLVTNETSLVPCVINTYPTSNPVSHQDKCITDFDSDEFIDDSKIDTILNEIENEMCKGKINPELNTKISSNNDLFIGEEILYPRNSFPTKLKDDFTKNTTSQKVMTKFSSHKSAGALRKRKPSNTPKSNYNFITLLERNLSLSDDDDKMDPPQNDTGFSDTIKNEIQKYLAKTRSCTNVPNKHVEMLLDKQENEQINDNERLNDVISINHNLYPTYEIVEIIGDAKFIKQNSNILHDKAKQAENPISYEDFIHDNFINKTNIEKQLTPSNNTEIVTFANAQSTNFTIQKLDEDNPIKKLYLSDDRNGSIEISTNTENNKREEYKSYGESGNNKTNVKHEEDTTKISNECRVLRVNNRKPHINTFDSREFCKAYNEINNTLINELPTLNINGSSDSLCNSTNLYNKRKYPKICESAEKSNLAKITPSEIMSVDENNKEFYTGNLIADEINGINNFNHNRRDKTSDDLSPINYINSSDQSKKINIYQQKAEYVNRYTYSTSKIDVCTKDTPEYCVQVIKKVKMDLDITEIVSRKCNHLKKSKNYKDNVNDIMMSMVIPNPENILRDNNEDSIKCNINNINYMHNLPKINLPTATMPKSELLPKNMTLNKVIAPKSYATDNPPVTNRNDTPIAMYYTNIQNTLSQKKCEEVTISEITDEDFKPESDSRLSTQDMCKKLRDTNPEDNTVNENCKIKNILHKYGKILGKNTTQSATPSSSGMNRNVNCKKSPTIKSKSKPFKISDIHKLHATLPDTITDPKSQTSNSLVLISKKNESVDKEMKHEVPNIIQHKQCNKIRPVEETVTQYQSLTHLDLEPIHLPVNVDLEPCKDFKIDQSMFDPKTLLQCAVDDDCDEIVPPPPEFCDGFSYSPDYNTTTDSFSNNNNQPDYSTERDIDYNECLFDDPSPTKFTPSCEIETWELSRENNSNSSTNSSPVKSCTAMRKDNKHEYLVQNSLISRQIKLGKFRVTQKNKLKIRK